MNVEFDPKLVITKTGPGAGNVGQNRTFTLRVSHANDSDGSPVDVISVVDDIAGTAQFQDGDDSPANGLLDDGETLALYGRLCHSAG